MTKYIAHRVSGDSAKAGLPSTTLKVLRACMYDLSPATVAFLV